MSSSFCVISLVLWTGPENILLQNECWLVNLSETAHVLEIHLKLVGVLLWFLPFKWAVTGWLISVYLCWPLRECSPIDLWTGMSSFLWVIAHLSGALQCSSSMEIAVYWWGEERVSQPYLICSSETSVCLSCAAQGPMIRPEYFTGHNLESRAEIHLDSTRIYLVPRGEIWRKYLLSSDSPYL